MAKHRHSKHYANLVSTFALTAFGLLTVVSAKYQASVLGEVSRISNRAPVEVSISKEDVREAAQERRDLKTPSRNLLRARARHKAATVNGSRTRVSRPSTAE